MNFLRRNKNTDKTELPKTHGLPEEKTELQNELITLIDEQHASKLKEFIDGVVDRLNVTVESYKNIAKKGGFEKNYNGYRCNSAISDIYVRDYISDEDFQELTSRVSNKFKNMGFNIEKLKCYKNEFGYVVFDIIVDWKTATFGEALVLKNIAETFNSRPILRDDLNVQIDKEDINNIIVAIENYLRRTAKQHGVVPQIYVYDFPEGSAQDNFTNSCYRKTMETVINQLPREFIAVKGSLIRGEKNSIRGFCLDFKFEL